MINLEDLCKNLKKEKSVAIISHIRPDGDTIGSSLGLLFALRKLNIKAKVYCGDNIPAKFSYLSGYEEFSSQELEKDITAIISVDCADTGRLGVYEQAFIGFQNTYNIDHHISNTRFAKYDFVEEHSANAENVLALIKLLNVEIDGNISNALATGIITDSGNFRHKNVTENTLKSATELFSLGADFHNIIFHTFNEQRKERAKLFAITMDRIRYYLDDKFAVGIVRLADFEKTGAYQDETEGFIDFIMGIKGVKVGAMVMETEPNKYKISFRAETADVNYVASTFGGGGHVLASGCRINGDLEEVIDKITFAVSRVIDD